MPLPLALLAAPAALSIGSSIFGAINAGDSADRQRRAQRQALAAQRQANAEAQGYLDPYAQAGTRALSDLADFQDYALPGEFDASGYNVGAYLDPSMQFQQAQMARNVEASAAARGGLMSGAAAKELQNRGSQLAQTDYGNAFARMQTDKNFAYNQYTNRFNQVRMQNQDRLSRLQNMGNMGFQANVSKANLATGMGTAQANYAQNMGNISAQMEMLPSQTMNNLGSNLMSIGIGGYQAGMFGQPGVPMGTPTPTAQTPAQVQSINDAFMQMNNYGRTNQSGNLQGMQYGDPMAMGGGFA